MKSSVIEESFDMHIAEPVNRWTGKQMASFAFVAYLFPVVALIACVRALFCRDMDRRAAVIGFTSILAWMVFAFTVVWGGRHMPF